MGEFYYWMGNFKKIEIHLKPSKYELWINLVIGTSMSKVSKRYLYVQGIEKVHICER